MPNKELDQLYDWLISKDFKYIDKDGIIRTGISLKTWKNNESVFDHWGYYIQQKKGKPFFMYSIVIYDEERREYLNNVVKDKYKLSTCMVFRWVIMHYYRNVYDMEDMLFPEKAAHPKDICKELLELEEIKKQVLCRKMEENKLK